MSPELGHRCRASLQGAGVLSLAASFLSPCLCPAAFQGCPLGTRSDLWHPHPPRMTAFLELPQGPAVLTQEDEAEGGASGVCKPAPCTAHGLP